MHVPALQARAELYVIIWFPAFLISGWSRGARDQRRIRDTGPGSLPRPLKVCATCVASSLGVGVQLWITGRLQSLLDAGAGDLSLTGTCEVMRSLGPPFDCVRTDLQVCLGLWSDEPNTRLLGRSVFLARSVHIPIFKLSAIVILPALMRWHVGTGTFGVWLWFECRVLSTVQGLPLPTFLQSCMAHVSSQVLQSRHSHKS